jgi:hypothetical protein
LKNQYIEAGDDISRYAAFGALGCRRPAWRRALDDAGGYAPIAKTFDSDLSLVARHLADSRTAGHTAMDLEAQGLRRCLRIGRKSDIDKIGHLDFP